MIKLPFFSKSIRRSAIGIDIGVSAIKLVEISRRGGKINLDNYGQVAASSFYQKPFETFGRGSFAISSPDVSKIIKAIMKESGIKSKESVFTIPDFSSFFTSFELPQMSQEELPSAIEFEARRHIPVPVSEVVLDYFLTKGKPGGKEEKLEVLLIAVPNEVIAQYQEIANSSGLELKYLEAEAFSLTRALAKNYKEPVCLLDIGAQSTTINITNQGKLKASFSSDIAGNNFTHAVKKSLSIDFQKAEFLKMEHGLESEEIEESLLPLINLIIIELEKIFQDFERSEQEKIQRIIVGGGSAFLPGLIQYISSHFKKETIIANPFLNFTYPDVLKKELSRLGPSLVVATGAALRNLI